MPDQDDSVDWSVVMTVWCSVYHATRHGRLFVHSCDA
jgi:hypothetical protein